MKRFIIATMFLNCLAAPAAMCEEITISRYAAISDEIDTKASEPLTSIATFNLPKKINKVGEAFEYVLSATGYKLDTTQKAAFVLYMHDLPEVQRKLGPNSVMSILKTLGGPAFKIKNDDLFRTVAITANRDIPTSKLLEYEDAWLSHQIKNVPNVRVTPAHIDLKNGYAVNEGDSLSEIALSQGIHKSNLKNWMQSVLSNNPHAFLDSNVNKLLSGVIITLPSIGEG